MPGGREWTAGAPLGGPAAPWPWPPCGSTGRRKPSCSPQGWTSTCRGRGCQGSHQRGKYARMWPVYFGLLDITRIRADFCYAPLVVLPPYPHIQSLLPSPAGCRVSSVAPPAPTPLLLAHPRQVQVPALITRLAVAVLVPTAHPHTETPHTSGFSSILGVLVPPPTSS